MGFNTFQFILVFLPLCYFGFLCAHRVLGWNGAFGFLAAASLVFYAQFSMVLAAILVASVVLNYNFASVIVTVRERNGPAGWLTAGAIFANLCALGYFKYTNFFLDISNTAIGTSFLPLDIIVPVGVSFFTFTQIGFLLETLSGQASRVGFSRYALFATFFPCVTAGPLLLQREIFPQMEAPRKRAFDTTALAVGLTMFGIGLFKKVVFADSLAPYADLAFDGVALGAMIGTFEAWVASFAYTLQLYFDFSGYSDMAVGLGFIFGLKLPLNFNSPFKATSISDFWRRWHMTMTRFFTTYLFSPMAMKGARASMRKGHGPVMKWLSASAVPVFYTFLLAGIWHGAGWTFVLYGAIHGAALAIDHGWRQFRLPSLGREVGWALTMLTVVVGLVVFRAPDLPTAMTMLSSMAGMAGRDAGFGVVEFDTLHALVLIVAFGALVLLSPNSQQLLRAAWVSSDPLPDEDASELGALRWQPSATWAAVAACVLVVGVASLGGDANFLYYKF